MPKTNNLHWLALGIALAVVGVAAPALAQVVQPVIIDGIACPGPGITERVVGCVQNALVQGAQNVLLPFSNAFNQVVRVLITLAVVGYGFLVMLGRQQPVKPVGLMLAIKIGFVVLFTWNFGNMLPAVMNVMAWLASAVSTYASLSMTLNCPLAESAWQRLDCVLSGIIGNVLPGTSLASGILAFLAGCLFSGALGVTIFITGILTVFGIIMAICKVVYIYLSALISLVLLICLSPLFIPLILFKVTSGYFEKWLRLFLGVFVQPLLLLAYMTMLLAALDVMVFEGPKSLYRTIAGNAAMQPNFEIGAYMQGVGAYQPRSELNLSVNLNPQELSSALNIGPVQDTGILDRMGLWARSTLNFEQFMSGNNAGVTLDVQGIDFTRLAAAQGLTFTEYIVRVMLSLLTCAITTYIFYTLLTVIPQLSAMVGHDAMRIQHLGAVMESKMQDFSKSVLAGVGGGGGGR